MGKCLAGSRKLYKSHPITGFRSSQDFHDLPVHELGDIKVLRSRNNHQVLHKIDTNILYPQQICSVDCHGLPIVFHTRFFFGSSLTSHNSSIGPRSLRGTILKASAMISLTLGEKMGVI